jgi:beta-xylosidase
MMRNFIILFLYLSIASIDQTVAQNNLSKVWVPDNGDGTYKNPVLNADYSDPDVIRVGEDYYLVSSSFNCVPGLPVLHSKDLVNWTLAGHALNRLIPAEIFDKPQHGNGVWAPAIRYHNNEFYIYYPDPDFGIFLVRAKKPEGPWSEPVPVLPGKGIIDPCPFWDDDGNCYLIHAWAGSRAGIKSILTLNRMNSEGTKVIDDGVLIFDGHGDQPTVEGPKLYKRNGYYYIFAPAGGVSTGWQLVLRSKNIYGPYEKKIVMDQGKTTVNGPHQGAWVETQKGESWFLHFQDAGPYGRVIHLQPLKWINDWPVIGIDHDGDGRGEPVMNYRKPDTGKSYPFSTPPESDEFNNLNIGLQWQWHANPKSYWAFPTGPSGFLRLYAIAVPENFSNFFDVPNLLLQKFPAVEFTATTKISFKPLSEGDKTGLIIMGSDYAYLSVKQINDKVILSQTVCKNADKKNPEEEGEQIPLSSETIYLRVKVSVNALCSFSYSTDGTNYIPAGTPFNAKQGRWIGAKAGLFCAGRTRSNDTGYADIDWFRIE